jgi:hypothetical protein
MAHTRVAVAAGPSAKSTDQPQLLAKKDSTGEVMYNSFAKDMQSALPERETIVEGGRFPNPRCIGSIDSVVVDGVARCTEANKCGCAAHIGR